MTTTVIRKPLPVDRDHDHGGKATTFPSMPILYLEFLENTNNVKKELVGKDYVPVPAPAPEYVPSDDEHDILMDFRHDREMDTGDDVDLEPPPKKVARFDIPPETDPQTVDPKQDVEAPVDTRPTPPSLAELRAKNQAKSLKSSDYKYPQEDDDETIKKRNDVFFHYEVLKKMHPAATIPEFSVYSDPEVMAQKYEFLAKKLSLDSSVENWKRYMIIFVMGCEVGLGKLNFDMEGFAQQQISSMNTYDQLLVEMAEKSYVPSGNRWPVEVRLMMMLTMNVVLFVVSKMIFKKTGTNLLGSINEITGIKAPASPNLKDP